MNYIPIFDMQNKSKDTEKAFQKYKTKDEKKKNTKQITPQESQ